MLDNLTDRLDDLHPQLFRELKSQFTSKNLIVMAVKMDGI